MSLFSNPHLTQFYTYNISVHKRRCTERGEMSSAKHLQLLQLIIDEGQMEELKRVLRLKCISVTSPKRHLILSERDRV